MTRSAVSEIKRAQRESTLLRIISELIAQLSRDDNRLTGIFVTRVLLNSDKSSCTIFFYMHEGALAFKEKLEALKLYKPSLRKAIAIQINGRYTPDLIFRFDDKFEKTARIEALLDTIKFQESDES